MRRKVRNVVTWGVVLGIVSAGIISFPTLVGAHRVEFILDASGSMWGKAGAEEKIVAAKRVMKDLVQNIELAPDSTLGLVVYGHRRKGDCADIEQFEPVSYTERASLLPIVDKISPKGKTPIADTLAAVGESLKGSETTTSMVLVSDGIESCGKDPCDIARQLRKQYGIDVTIHVVGFDVQDGREQLECIAAAGGGRYFNAENTDELTAVFEDIKAELRAADQTAPPPPPPAQKKEKKIKRLRLSRATISIPNLSQRKVIVCTQESKCDYHGSKGWIGELTPQETSKEVNPGTYKLKFHNHYMEGIEVAAGSPTEIRVGTLSVPNVSGRSLAVCDQNSKCDYQGSRGWAGAVSSEANSLEVPAGTYKLKFHNHYADEIAVKAGEPTEVTLGQITIPNLTARSLLVCSQESKCDYQGSGGCAGEITPETSHLAVPVGTYKLKFHNHYLEGIEVAATGPTMVEVGELSMPSLTGSPIPVCSMDSKCEYQGSRGWIGELTAKATSLEVPAGTYKLKMGKQFIDDITVAAGEKLVIE